VHKYAGGTLTSVDKTTILGADDVVGISGSSTETVMVTATKLYRSPAGSEFSGGGSVGSLDCANFRGVAETTDGVIGVLSGPGCDAGAGELWVAAPDGGVPAPALVLPAHDFVAIAAGSADDWVAVGDTACEFVSQTRSTTCGTGSGLGLNGVGRASSSDVWAVGGGCSFYQSVTDGKTWSQITGSSIACPVSKPTLRGVWFATNTQGWAVGDDGTILQFDGSSWKPVNTSASGQLPIPIDLRAIHAATNTADGGADVWAVGVSGTLLHLHVP
jgi:photosystem II stability/assembly factor-like uncharacterized protein